MYHTGFKIFRDYSLDQVEAQVRNFLEKFKLDDGSSLLISLGTQLVIVREAAIPYVVAVTYEVCDPKHYPVHNLPEENEQCH